jgi:hypothetical protein
VAVEGFVHVLANELRGREITVNAVAPGPVVTELFLKGKSEAQVEQFRKIPPLERLGQPEDIADVVSFLAGPTGGWVNSQVIRANAVLREPCGVERRSRPEVAEAQTYAAGRPSNRGKVCALDRQSSSTNDYPGLWKCLPHL